MVFWLLCVCFFTGNMNLVVLLTSLLLGNSTHKVDISVETERRVSTVQNPNWQTYFLTAIWKQNAELLKYQRLWEQFKYKYNKFYLSEKEDKRRMNIFIDNAKFIDDHNQLYSKGLSTFELGHNEFMDLTHEEFLEKYTTYKKLSFNSEEHPTVKSEPTVRYDPYLLYDSIYNDDPTLKNHPTVQDDPTLKSHPTVQNDPTLKYHSTVQDDPTLKNHPTVQVDPTLRPEPTVQYHPTVQSDYLYDYVEENNEKFLSEEYLDFLPPSFVQIPMVVDWRPTGAVTLVKNQGRCKASWLFSATGALEGQLYRKHQNTTPLSEQNILDCSDKYGNDGCHNGTPATAFKYIMMNGGVNTNMTYPWKGQQSMSCSYKKLSNNTKVRGIVTIQSGNETALAAAVATVGPISVAVDASSRKFKFYKQGIYDDLTCTTHRLNYEMLAVGYGKSYWIVKNSLGPRWGVKGYIYMRKNRANQCGIASKALYPLI